LYSHQNNEYSMGVEIRKTIKEGDCTCFLFPHKKAGKSVHLCFHKGILGAMSDEQEGKYCTPRSFIPKQEGGVALDIRSEKVQAMVAAMKGFGQASSNARSKYQAKVEDDGERDMDAWRETVGKEVSSHAPKKEKPRKLTKRERIEARSDALKGTLERALEIEERTVKRKHGAKSVEGWDSAKLGDYE
jgi:hypothetical protein